MLIVMVTTDQLLLRGFVYIVIKGSRLNLLELLMLRHRGIPQVAEGPFYFVDLPSYDLSILLLFYLSLDPLLHGGKGPGEKFLRYLNIVLILLDQAELSRVVILRLIEVDDDFLAESGKYPDALTALHHADYGAVLEHDLDRFIAVSGEFVETRHLHLLVYSVLIRRHQRRL